MNVSSKEKPFGHHNGKWDDYCNEHSDSDCIQHDVLLLLMVEEGVA